MQLNARSHYRSKLDIFKDNLRKINPSFVLLSETHLVDSHPVSFVAYNSFVKNRTDRNGGGVAILVKKSIPVSLVQIPYFVHLECVGVSVKLPDGKNLILISIYGPKGDADPSEKDSLFNLFDNAMIIGGDFNAHNPMWHSYGSCNHCGSSLANFLNSNLNITLYTPPNLPTRIDPSTAQYSTLDLTFATSDKDHLLQTGLGPSTWESDHVPISLSIN